MLGLNSRLALNLFDYTSFISQKPICINDSPVTSYVGIQTLQAWIEFFSQSDQEGMGHNGSKNQARSNPSAPGRIEGL